jgi:hypothetical protein
MASSTTLGAMGTTARHALTQNQTAHRLVLSVIGSLAGSLAFLMLVGVATWIIISSGAGHPPWQ